MQILARISCGFGLGGALNYDFAPCKKTGKPRAELVCGTLQGTPRQICKQAAPLRGLRNIAKPIWRASLNADPGDGIISAEKWTEICRDFLLGMGLNPDTAAWVAVRHTDHHYDRESPRDHVHLTVLRQQVDGSLFNIANDVFRSKKVTEQLEIKHQLTKHNREPAQRRVPTVAQQSAFKRTGKMATQQTIQNKVDQVFSEEKNNLSFPTLKEKLHQKRIGIKPKITKGRLMGFSYEDFSTGVKMPGSKLGTDYSLGLLTRGLKFDANEVQEELEEQKPGSKMPPALKSILLPEQYGAKQIRPHAAHQTEVSLNTEKFNAEVVNLQVGPAAKVMLIIGGLLAQASVFLIEKIIAFLKRLLQAFGFSMVQSDIQKHEHPDPKAPALCYEPSQLSLPSPKSAQDKCSEELIRVAEALEQNDHSLLPVVLGTEKERSEVQAAMMIPAGLSGVATVVEDDFGFSDSDFASTDSPQIGPIEVLKTALKASEMADFSLVKAQRKNVPLHVDVADVEEKYHSQVKNALSKAKEDFASWKKSNFFDANNPFSPTKAAREAQIKSLERQEKEAAESHELAVAKTKKYVQMLKDAPAPVVPQAIKDAAESARQKLRVARQAIHDQAILTIEAFKLDSRLLMKAGVFKFELLKSLEEFHQSEKISVVQMSELERQWAELNKLKQQHVESGFVPPVPTHFETDEEADKPIIDGQIVK